MKNISLLILCLFSILNSSAQSYFDDYNIGCYSNLYGDIVEGYLDFDFNPSYTFSLSDEIVGKYTRGHYFDLHGAKKEGFIQYYHAKRFFRFKADKNDDDFTLIKAKACKEFTVGDDRFISIKADSISWNQETSIFTQDYFIEVLDNFENKTFYKFLRPGSNSPTIYYLVESDSLGRYEAFPNQNKKFMAFAKSLFPEYTSILKDIDEKKYTKNTIQTLIKNFKYTYLHTNDKPIFYTSVWVETSDKENSKYFARINSIVDTTFYLTFYTIDEKKIFDGEFSSLVPLKRAGTFTFYNEDGTKRRELVYSDNKLVGGKVYFQNGDLHRSFQIEDSEMLYSTVKAANGESVLNNLGNGTEKYFDNLREKEITFCYSDSKLTQAYYTKQPGDTIYLICPKSAKIVNYSELKGYINRKISYPEDALDQLKSATIPVKLLINDEKEIVSYKVLIDSDSLFLSTVIEVMDHVKKKALVKSAKAYKEKKTQEFLVFVDFAVSKFIDYSVSYNNYWHMNHMHNMHHMQQQQIQEAMMRDIQRQINSNPPPF
jgi:hypothetical protein